MMLARCWRGECQRSELAAGLVNHVNIAVLLDTYYAVIGANSAIPARASRRLTRSSIGQASSTVRTFRSQLSELAISIRPRRATCFMSRSAPSIYVALQPLAEREEDGDRTSRACCI